MPEEDGDNDICAPSGCGDLAGARAGDARASIIEAVTPVVVVAASMGAPADAAAASAEADARCLGRVVAGAAGVALTGTAVASVSKPGSEVAEASATAPSTSAAVVPTVLEY